MTKSMSLGEHRETADDLSIAAHHLSKVINRCQNFNCYKGRVKELLKRVCPGDPTSLFDTLTIYLDDEYLFLTGKDSPESVYADLDERFKVLSSRSDG